MKWMAAFGSHVGKGLLHKTPWSEFSDFYERITPTGDELWVTMGRINEIWQTNFDGLRNKYITDRWPSQFVEIHPDDANSRGIESGDLVLIENDDVLIQTGGFVGVEGDSQTFTGLEKAGQIRIGKGSYKAVAMVTTAIKSGVLWSNALDAKQPPNSVVHRVPDPITNRYRFKLGKGRIKKIGESTHKTEFAQMTFRQRDIL